MRLYKNLHPSTKLYSAKKKHKCEKCKKDIEIGDKYFKTNTKFITPFPRCMCCKPTRDEINEMIEEEMQDFHYEISIEEDF